MIYIRSALFNILFFGVLAFGCVLNSIIGVFNRKITVKIWNYVLIPFNVWLLKVVAGIKIEVRGRENIRQEGVIYASKHESSIETYALTNYIKKAVFILKKELTYIPVFGWAQALYGMVAVDRGAGGAVMKRMAKDVKNRMDNGRPLIMFPEGTRTAPETETVYKPGLYFIVQNLKKPVIPVALNTGLFWKKHSFIRYPGTIVIEFLEPMPDNLGKEEFMTELQRRIEAKCTELNNEAAAKYPHAKLILEQNKGLKNVKK